MIVIKVVCPLFLVVETVLYFILAFIQTKIIEKPNKRFLTLSPFRIANIMPDSRQFRTARLINVTLSSSETTHRD